MKYTKELIKCPKCKRTNYFHVSIVKQKRKYYTLTQCPKCKQHEDIRALTTKETEALKKTKDSA